MAPPAGNGAGHLPNRGGAAGKQGGEPPRLPRQRRGVTPQMHGRYPDYDVMSETEHWDPVTRELIVERVEKVPEIRFFDERQAQTLRAFCDVAMAQESDPRIPVLEMVDEKFYEGRLDGFRHHDMPPDPQTWKIVAAKLDQAAAAEGFTQGLAAAPQDVRFKIVERFAKGELEWEELSSEKAWKVMMRAVLSAFYSHPWAWNEIGFGGPAYPRGYARLGAGQREHWESPPEFDVDPVRDVHERGLE